MKLWVLSEDSTYYLSASDCNLSSPSYKGRPSALNEQLNRTKWAVSCTLPRFALIWVMFAEVKCSAEERRVQRSFIAIAYIAPWMKRLVIWENRIRIKAFFHKIQVNTNMSRRVPK